MLNIKLSLLKFSTLALSIFLISSCSNNEQEVVTASADNTLLLKNLSDFNNSYEHNQAALKCSGFWECLGDVVVVAGADIAGAAGGVVAVKEAALVLGATTGGTGGVVLVVGAGVVVGAGTSIVAARSLDSSKRLASASHGTLKITLPTDYFYLQNVGIDHNNVLQNNFFNDEPIDKYYSSLKLTADQIKIMDSEYMKEANKKLEVISSNYVKNKFDYKTMTQEMKDQKLLTADMKDILDLFLEKYVSCSEDQEIESTVNFYIKEVSASKLTEIEKQGLLASFMVASESPYYWMGK